MVINIEDVQIGDEILIACQSHFKWIKILQKPVLGKPHSWRPGIDRYKSVKCTSNRKATEHYRKDYRNPSNTQGILYYKYEWIVSGENHNWKYYQNLNDKQLWLLKRDEL